jgi:hypothetical protein
MIDPLLMHRRFRSFAAAGTGRQAHRGTAGRARARRGIPRRPGEG